MLNFSIKKLGSSRVSDSSRDAKMLHAFKWMIALVVGLFVGYAAALLISFPITPQHRWQPGSVEQPSSSFEVIGIGWAGTRTPYFENTLTFFQQVLQLPLTIQSDQFAEFRLSNGDRLGITRANQWVSSRARGPQFEFLVTDIKAAQATLSANGVQFLGELQQDSKSGIAWVQFWGPDGYVYGLTSTPKAQALDQP
jgi:predicted enzyme related to lactoylglutathione lyase